MEEKKAKISCFFTYPLHGRDAVRSICFAATRARVCINIHLFIVVGIEIEARDNGDSFVVVFLFCFSLACAHARSSHDRSRCDRLPYHHHHYLRRQRRGGVGRQHFVIAEERAERKRELTVTYDDVHPVDVETIKP